MVFWWSSHFFSFTDNKADESGNKIDADTHRADKFLFTDISGISQEDTTFLSEVTATCFKGYK